MFLKKLLLKKFYSFVFDKNKRKFIKERMKRYKSVLKTLLVKKSDPIVFDSHIQGEFDSHIQG